MFYTKYVLWKGAGVDERARLESECLGNGTVGSNPTPSALINLSPSHSLRCE